MKNNKSFNEELIRDCRITQFMLVQIWITMDVLSALLVVWYSLQINNALYIPYRTIIIVSVVIINLMVLFQNFLPIHQFKKQIKTQRHAYTVFMYIRIGDYMKECCLQNAICAALCGVFVWVLSWLFACSILPLFVVCAITILACIILMFGAFMLIFTEWELQLLKPAHKRKS